MSKIKCLVCHKEFRMLQPGHLLHHNMTVKQYKDFFSIDTVVSDDLKNDIRETLLKKWKLGLINLNEGNFKNGRIPWNKGNGEYMKNEKNPFFGKKHTIEAKEKNRIKHLGKKYTNESVKKREITRKQRYAIWHSGKTKEKIRLSKLGELNPNWLNGVSYEPYAKEFNKILKKEIRKRDEEHCKLCGREKKDNTRKKYELAIHHINYNKKDSNFKNLITLCSKCNIKVNKDRSMWTLFFQTFLENKYGYKILEDLQ